MILNDYYVLNNGVKIPKIGYGTWLIDNNKVVSTVKLAIKCGYIHIDTAQRYGNEEGVGKGIRESKINRKDLFVTTKLEAYAKNKNDAKKLIDCSFKKLNIGYIDMIIIHSPQPWQYFRSRNRYFAENIEVWKILEWYYKNGYVKAIGVSNFEIEDINNLLNNCEIKPMVNQILTHITNTPMELIKFCQKNQILVEAYSPLGHKEILNNPVILKIAQKYNVSSAQLCVKYCLQLGLLPIPKASTINHIKDNANIDNFEISKKDMDILLDQDVIKNYGNASCFPVFGGKIDKNQCYKKGNFIRRK